MKNLRFCILPLLLAFILGLNLVEWDIIDSNRKSPEFVVEKSVSLWWNWALVPDLIWDFVYSSMRILFLIAVCILSMFIIFSLLVHIFEKFVWRTKKYLIPSFKWMKMWLFVAFVLFILGFILELWLRYNDSSLCGGGYQVYKEGSYCPIYGNSVQWMIKFIKDISYCLCLLLLSFVVLIAYNRLYKNFGWSKFYSVLWAIFFPIWMCVLYFWKFEYQWENLEWKKENL